LLRGFCGSTECTGDCNDCGYPIAHEDEEEGEGIFEEWERAGGIYALASRLVRAELKMLRGAAPGRNETPHTQNPNEGGSI
jgi:hypothetical protein